MLQHLRQPVGEGAQIRYLVVEEFQTRLEWARALCRRFPSFQIVVSGLSQIGSRPQKGDQVLTVALDVDVWDSTPEVL